MSSRAMKPPGGECHDLWGAEFKGTPCHHRVLKPPGGGTSDIFGTSEPQQQSHTTRNHLQSSVFGNDVADAPQTPRTGKIGIDSYTRLFGPAESRPPSAVKDRMKSNIPIGGIDERDGIMHSEADIKANLRRNPVTGDGVCDLDTQNMQRNHRKRGGNPVTGEGYNAMNGDSKEVESKTEINGTNGVTTNGVGAKTPSAQHRGRVPPGGYSSGLW